MQACRANATCNGVAHVPYEMLTRLLKRVILQNNKDAYSTLLYEHAAQNMSHIMLPKTRGPVPLQMVAVSLLAVKAKGQSKAGTIRTTTSQEILSPLCQVQSRPCLFRPSCVGNAEDNWA